MQKFETEYKYTQSASFQIASTLFVQAGSIVGGMPSILPKEDTEKGGRDIPCPQISIQIRMHAKNTIYTDNLIHVYKIGFLKSLITP